jgi:hypothetical protein
MAPVHQPDMTMSETLFREVIMWLLMKRGVRLPPGCLRECWRAWRRFIEAPGTF